MITQSKIIIPIAQKVWAGIKPHTLLTKMLCKFVCKRPGIEICPVVIPVTIPSQKNIAPMVVIKDGRPSFATSMPFKTPTPVPAHKAPSEAIIELPVDKNMYVKTIAESAIAEEKDKSNSPQTTTNVSEIATMAIIAVKASMATYIEGLRKAKGFMITNIAHIAKKIPNAAN
jgi:hypothetical protein